MPNIIGNFESVITSIPPLEAHTGHLRYLTNEKITKDLLSDVHGMTATDAKDTAKIFSPHIRQALNFHNESKNSIPSIRPVLQYYSYLNLAVAAILAFRPSNFNQYRRHGVEDRTHSLSKLDLSSEVLKIKRGAAPLFHSIFSDTSLYNKKFRFGQLASGFHMFSHELSNRFNKKTQKYDVKDEVRNVDGRWYSVYKFFEYDNKVQKKAPQKRIEDAMPLLKSDYDCNNTNATQLEYISKQNWSNEANANKVHRKNGIKFINYGGHRIQSDALNGPTNIYIWNGISRIPLLPTLTSILLLSFSLASIVRYRPLLFDVSMNSPILLLIDTFVSEADSVFISSMRNLLYREEIAVGYIDYI
jgi:hypothetical protein